MILMYVLISVVFIVVLRYLRVLTSVPLYALYWKRLAKKAYPSNAFKIVVIGDSVAQGIGSTRISQSFVRRIIRATELQTFRPVHIVNFSVTGAKINDAIETQIPQFKECGFKPDLLLVELGANDIKTFTPQSFESNYKNLLSLLPKNAILAEVPPFGGAKEERVLQANEIIRRLAKQRHFTLVPLHSAVMGDLSIRNNSGDFFHPGNRGHLVWFNGFWPIIKKHLGSAK